MENWHGRGGNICPISTPRPSVGLRVTQPKKTRVEARRKQGIHGRAMENWDRLNDGAAPGVVIKPPFFGGWSALKGPPDIVIIKTLIVNRLLEIITDRTGGTPKEQGVMIYYLIEWGIFWKKIIFTRLAAI